MDEYTIVFTDGIQNHVNLMKSSLQLCGVSALQLCFMIVQPREKIAT